MAFILTYDIGTTGVKTCLFEVGKTIRLIDSTSAGYPLYILEGGGAEQDGDDWWNGMAVSTDELFRKVDVTPDQIEGISFCSQMQGLVIVDKTGEPIHRPMSYMDQRAKEELKKGIAYGIQIAGLQFPSGCCIRRMHCSRYAPVLPEMLRMKAPYNRKKHRVQCRLRCSAS